MISSPNSTVYKRLTGIIILIIIGSFAFLFFFFRSYSASLENEKKAQSKHISEVGISTIEHLYQLSLTGKLSLTDAQNLALSLLESATYEDNGYFWINNGEGILLMQPFTPERVGINQLDWTDSNGRYIFQDFILKAKAGGDWVVYN
ncbi:MAG: cache domain-containing protein [Spirochaetales bacterium]|nr:cache domain-containing protein [Spirochaetales bacterium]